MNVYVESNFVLELALLQEQFESCENILAICEAGRAKLVLPAFSMAEPYGTLARRAKRRAKLASGLTSELRQLSRSEPYRENEDDLQDLTNILIRSGEEEKQRLDLTFDKILNLKVAEIIPLERDILRSAFTYQASSSLGLSAPDSIVYASVIYHLSTATAEKSCFLNKDAKDFDDPDIVGELGSYNCKLLPSFDSGYDYIQSQIRSQG